MVSFAPNTTQETIEEGNNNVRNTTTRSFRQARASMRQSIVGRMSILFGHRQALTFDDQVSNCKCAPMDKAMAHPRTSELVDLTDLEVSTEFMVDEDHDRPFNSDEAKNRPKPQEQDFMSFLIECITAPEEQETPHDNGADDTNNKNDNGEKALGKNKYENSSRTLEEELLDDSLDDSTHSNDGGIMEKLAIRWSWWETRGSTQ